MEGKIEEILKKAGISPTPVRILVYRCLLNSSIAMSLSDIETTLESVDKSSISRTLSSFRLHHLLHSFNDGSGAMKYELCKSHDDSHHEDLHVHFRCENCGVTTCLTSINIPPVSLPEGYLMREVTYIISGICKNCSERGMSVLISR